MFKWIKINPGLSSITGIIISLPMLWGIYHASKMFKHEIDDYIKSCVVDYMNSTPDRLEAKMAEGLGIPTDKVAPYSIKVLKKHESITYVGLYLENSEEGLELFYRHINAKRYHPHYWDEKKRYYFKFSDGSWEYCQ